MNLRDKILGQKYSADGYNGEPVKPSTPDDHSGALQSEGHFPYREAPAPIGDDDTEYPVPFEVETHADREVLRGYIDKPDKVQPPEHVVPVRVVDDVRSTYFSVGQVSVAPGRAVRLLGAIPGRFSAKIRNIAETGGGTVYIGADSLVSSGNGYPLDPGDTLPELKHDKEVWAYVDITETEPVVCATFSQVSQGHPVYPAVTKPLKGHH
jgi:hypothetical protein